MTDLLHSLILIVCIYMYRVYHESPRALKHYNPKPLKPLSKLRQRELQLKIDELLARAPWPWLISEGRPVPLFPVCLQDQGTLSLSTYATNSPEPLPKKAEGREADCIW